MCVVFVAKNLIISSLSAFNKSCVQQMLESYLVQLLDGVLVRSDFHLRNACFSNVYRKFLLDNVNRVESFQKNTRNPATLVERIPLRTRQMKLPSITFGDSRNGKKSAMEQCFPAVSSTSDGGTGRMLEPLSVVDR